MYILEIIDGLVSYDCSNDKKKIGLGDLIWFGMIFFIDFFKMKIIIKI